ncbi:MAG: M56 family metallopeptidase [Cryobacterium sp.]|uniref:M56 family metallopeptidase n=1 Tax=unclassified Cryobacterium TaxID=2649013 RepID=UPI0018CA2F4F|nr:MULTISPECIES: M56 family metallopeptidase [unclassified Cryobacterium]MCY7404562.1 M56 family metallopeptidase [Cryobacterium sp.]MEC5153907.1 Zn-dependent protease with chaperone function [Cryobacterium sp. CAN_C3]
MITAAVMLGIIAVLLAWPVPLVLARSDWPARSPGVALVLWQAIALSGGMSMIGSLLLYGLVPFGDTLPQSIVVLVGDLRAGTLPAGTSFTHVLALGSAILLGTHLLLNLLATFVRAERQRRRHHTLIALLSDPLHGQPGMRVIDHPAPVAYCLPGAGHSATVLSNGLLRLLDTDQVRAVIAHEQAHLVQQHHLVLLAFKSWHSALPWFPIANRAENAVALLVEMLADDHARRVVDDHTLARAIALTGFALAGFTTPFMSEADAATSAIASASHTDKGRAAEPEHPAHQVTPRVARLVNPTVPLGYTATIGALTVSAVLLTGPALILFGA